MKGLIAVGVVAAMAVFAFCKYEERKMEEWVETW